nr:hypothetical protein Iba_scaffold38631CG0010 [Ipomoea batatas]
MIYDTSSLEFLEFLAFEQTWPRHFILAVKTGQRLHRQRIFDETFGCPSVFHALLSGGTMTVSDLNSGGGERGLAGRSVLFMWLAESFDGRRLVRALSGVSF